MVDIPQTLCTPAQARFFKQQGLVQRTRYAWVQEPDGRYDFVFNAPEGYPELTDWNKAEEECFAAFDNTDLGLLLAAVGYYPAGPSAPLPGGNDAHRWWCDSIQTFNSSVENTLYQGYGATEAEAKANMLIKAIRTGIIPIDWPYYLPERLDKLLKPNITDGPTEEL